MNKLKFLLLSLSVSLAFFQSAPSLTLEKARQFVSLFEKKENWCSYEKTIPFKDTLLEEAVNTLSVLDCYEESKLIEIRTPKNPYAAILYADLLLKNGKIREAISILRRFYSTSNQFDEDILTVCRGRCNFTSDRSILRKKIRLALKDRDFDYAEVLLSKLKGDPYYPFLKGLLLLKLGRKKEAIPLLESSPFPEKYIYLPYASKSDVAKLYYFKELLNSPVSGNSKRRVAVYILDRLLFRDRGLFRSAIKLVDSFDRKLAQEYMIKFFYVYGYKKKALKELKKLKGEKSAAWLSSIGGRKFEYSRIDFYSLLLNPPKTFPYKVSEKPDDEGLEFLYSKGFCWVFDFIPLKEASPEVSYYLNLCGNYHGALKVAVRFWNEVGKKPWLLKVLFPSPPPFDKDLISLSIARQESLFDRFALSRSGAMGLMQIMPKTGKYLAQRLKQNGFEVKHLFKPEVNVSFGSFYIHSLIDRFGSFPLAAAAYNCGPTRVSMALKRFGKIKNTTDLILFVDFYLPFSETRNYVKKVLVNYYFYSNLYGTGEEWKSSLIPSEKRDTKRIR